MSSSSIQSHEFVGELLMQFEYAYSEKKVVRIEQQTEMSR